MHIEVYDNRNFRILYIMVVCVLAFITCALFFGRFLYIFDKTTQKTETMEIVLPELSGNNAGIYFYKDGTKYEFNHNAKKTRNIEENFVGHLCEIEYFELSKCIKRIRLLE